MRTLFSALLLALWGLASPAQAAPTLVIQGDKAYQFRVVAVSDGGTWVAGGENAAHNIKVFDGRSGLQWGEIPASSGASPLRFTPDGTRLLTAKTLHYEQTPARVSVCAVPTGRTLRSFAIAPDPVWCDDTRLRGLRNGAIVEFDLRSGRRNFARKLEGAPAEGRYAFSRNGAFLVEGSRRVLRFWSVQSGRLMGRIPDRLRAIGRAAISDDGKWLASEGDDPDWRPPVSAASEAAYMRDFRLHVWNARTRKLVRTFPGYNSLHGPAQLLAFSPDARTLFGAGVSGLDRFPIAGGKNAPLPPRGKDFDYGMAGPLDVSGDGSWLAGDFGPELQLWHLPTSTRRARFAGALRGAGQVKWSPDGRYLAGGHRLTLWDARTGKLLAEKPDAYVYDFSWADATTIRSQTLGKMQLWSVPDLKLKSEFDFSATDPNGYGDGLSIAPDGRTILSTDTTGSGGFFRGELWVWDVASRKLLRKIKTDKDLWSYTEFSRIVWLPDNRRIVFGTRSKLILLDTQTGIVEREQADPVNPKFKAGSLNSALIPLRVSPDGKWLAATATRDGKTLVFDLETFALAPAAGRDWWESESASARRLRAAGAPEGEGALSPSGRLMAFGADGVTRNNVSIWNVDEGREAVRLYLLGGSAPSTALDWIAVTSAGFYDASPAGEMRLRWREGEAFWPVAKSRARFKRPDLVAEALRGTKTSGL